MTEPVESAVSLAQPGKRLVLLAEDDAATRDLYKTGLNAHEIECVEASTVDDALKLIEENSFDLIILDWDLDRSAAEVLRTTKQKYPKTLVIVVSGKDLDVRTDALLNQADAFLSKPVGYEILSRQVMQLLRLRAECILLPKREEDILPLETIKQIYIRHVVHLLGNNASAAAKALGVHRQTISALITPPKAPPSQKNF